MSPLASARWSGLLLVALLGGSSTAAGNDPPGKDAFRGVRAGDERTVAGVKLCWCPAGRFTMGSPASSIRTIFMLQGLIIGMVGTTAGAVFGSVLIYILDRYQLISVPVDVYQISYIPFKLQPLDFAVVVASAIAICFVATIYPSRQAAKLDPAQALRYQ